MPLCSTYSFVFTSTYISVTKQYRVIDKEWHTANCHILSYNYMVHRANLASKLFLQLIHIMILDNMTLYVVSFLINYSVNASLHWFLNTVAASVSLMPQVATIHCKPQRLYKRANIKKPNTKRSQVLPNFYSFFAAFLTYIYLSFSHFCPFLWYRSYTNIKSYKDIFFFCKSIRDDLSIVSLVTFRSFIFFPFLPFLSSRFFPC